MTNVTGQTGGPSGGLGDEGVDPEITAMMMDIGRGLGPAWLRQHTEPTVADDGGDTGDVDGGGGGGGDDGDGGDNGEPGGDAGQPGLDGDGRIRLRAAEDIHLTASQIEMIIRDCNQDELFRTQGRLTRVGRNDDDSPVIRELTESTLMRWLNRSATWFKVTANGVQRAVTPNTMGVKAVMSEADMLDRVSVLEQVRGMPFMAGDGSLVDTRGYSAASRTWFEPIPGVNVPAVPERPSAEEVKAALSLLMDDMLVDFAFEGEADRAHALSLLLLPFVREMIDGPTPLHLIDAVVHGSGKGLLAKVCLMVSQGVEMEVKPFPENEGELRKTITATLLEGKPVVMFDNVNDALDSGVLAAATTEPVWSDRRLGSTANITARIRCVWVITGNNLRVSGELARRSAPRIRLDPSTKTNDPTIAENPHLRAGFRHDNLVRWVKDHIAELAHAALVLVRSWVAAGSPAWSGRAIGSYESWSKTLGGILEHVGVAGFLSNMDIVDDDINDERDAAALVVETWWNRYGTGLVRTDDLAICDMEDYFEAANLVGRAAQTKIGLGLKKLRGRIIAGKKVTKNGRSWQLLEHVPGADRT